MAAREEILGRIRAALTDRPVPVTVPRRYRPAAGAGDVELFMERVGDYRATVHRCVREDVADAISGLLADRGIARVVVPDGLSERWLPHVQLVRPPVSVPNLDQISAVMTTCAVAIAETGTIVLDAGPGQGPRALTLVPDYHLVIVRVDQIRAGVPDAVAALDPRQPLTWISGPSATSDIELRRVEGVHGPRVLDVLVVG
jgi:L-lactate dehydrogenase complex protein LldG